MTNRSFSEFVLQTNDNASHDDCYKNRWAKLCARYYNM
jgi:hypothetical protein